MRTTLDEIARRRTLCGFYAVLFAVGAATLSPSSPPIHPVDHVAWAIAALYWLVIAVAPGRRRRLILCGVIGVAFTLRVASLFLAATVTTGNAIVASTVYLGYGVALMYIIIVWHPIRRGG